MTGIIRNNSQTYSKVTRVGRWRDGGLLFARIEFKGQPIDIPVSSGVDPAPLFHAIQNDGWVRAWLTVVSLRLVDGTLERRPRACRITRVERFDALTGAEFLAEARPLFDVPTGALGWGDE